ncbi:DinB family protein [Flavihumibacter fluvii]|uniref:DinB family protein n=1 Tax=Flavihumibacter fluvii TaxID=2838157 RepID=UPI001BDEE1A3|nr:DinB family protein [Flavihumibacter fluvii]ULQ51981.1 DinB family protein [Flavihumibacter fluvii]
MQFDIAKTLEIIERTPGVLHALLQGISGDWIYTHEGPGTWSVFDVVGHLIVCEKTDFIPRANIILSDAKNKTLDLLDMTAHFEWNKGKTMTAVLKEFEALRKENIQKLLAMKLTPGDLLKTGLHPKIGILTLRDLLATWAVHDLNHIAQVSRIMAKQYKQEVGPFIEFLSILK